MLIFDDVVIRQDAFELRADLEIARDRLTAVIGPSGAGKSTLLAVAAGFVSARAGRVLIDRRDVSADAPGARPVSIVFQDGNLFAHLSVAQNIGLGIRPSLKLDSADRDRIADVLNWVGLAGMADRKPAALSGGQQSRVALARVMLRDTSLVLLDEPFAALGPALKDEMLDLVARIMSEHGRTIVMVTHDARDAQRCASEVVLVADGVAHAPAPTDAFFADPSPELRSYLGT